MVTQGWLWTGNHAGEASDSPMASYECLGGVQQISLESHIFCLEMRFLD